MKAVWFPVAGAFAVAVTMLALLPANTQAQQSVTVNLTARNDSGMSGTAVLTPDGDGTKVVLTVSNAPGPHPAHIHSGQCPDVGAVVYPLTSVSEGKSETTVKATIADIMKQPMAINIHKSPQESSVYTACGNVTASAAGAPAAQPSPAAAGRSGCCTGRCSGRAAIARCQAGRSGPGACSGSRCEAGRVACRRSGTGSTPGRIACPGWPAAYG